MIDEKDTVIDDGDVEYKDTGDANDFAYWIGLTDAEKKYLMVLLKQQLRHMELFLTQTKGHYREKDDEEKKADYAHRVYNKLNHAQKGDVKIIKLALSSMYGRFSTARGETK